jgi:hypothetical protein
MMVPRANLSRFAHFLSLAQFAFSSLVLTSVGLAQAQNYTAIPFLILGLWKFGFPETLLYFHSKFVQLRLVSSQKQLMM